MTSIDIREAVHEDADTIVGLLLELMDVMEHPVEIDQGQIRSNCEKLVDSDAAALFVAERSGIAVGFLSLAFRVTCLHAGPSALIDELVVSESVRGEGVGSMLIEKAVEVSRAMGCAEVEVSTELGNQGAIDFYRGMGFEDCGVLLEMEL